MAILWRVPSAAESGFTLIETAVAAALLSAIAIASIIGLAHRGGEFEAGRAQVAAFLVMAKARAATNGDGNGNTGATVVATYEPSPSDATTLTLYDGRPFGGAPIARAPNVGSVRVPGQLALTSLGSPAASSQFAIFFGTSGATTALDRYTVNQTPIAAEPPCDLQTGLQLPYAQGQSVNAVALSCATGEVDPDASPVNQRRAALQQDGAS